jgi:DnaJ family protein A protein 2
MVRDTTLYDNLEIKTDATDTEIKKAYNRLSKLWHPDKHSQGDEKELEEAKVKFQTINQAKEILLDKEKREAYDQLGMDFLKGGMDAREGNPFGDFGNMFGQGSPFGFGGFGPGMRQQQHENENIMEELDVTLEQIYNESSVSFNYRYKHFCTKCDGEGTKNSKKSKCMQCDGKGMKVQIIRQGPMIQQSVVPCNFCRGTGVFIDDMNKCETCTGERFIIKDKSVSIPLKAGLANGNKISLEGKGHQFKNQKTDVILLINVLDNPSFKRLNDDLFIEVELKLYQALFGFEKIITHLDNRKLHISSSGKTDFNTTRKIAGEGMKKINNGQKGDLYIQFKISIPNLPLEMKNQLKPIFQNFDKQESQIESTINKLDNLTKTTMMDCRSDHVERLYKAIDDNKQKREQSRHQNNGFDNGGQQAQCAQS